MHSNSNHFALDFITVVCGLHEFIRLVRLEYMLFSMEAPIIFTIWKFLLLGCYAPSLRIDYYSRLLAVKQLYNIIDQMEGFFLLLGALHEPLIAVS